MDERTCVDGSQREYERAESETFLVIQRDTGSRFDTEYLMDDSARFGDAPTCESCGEFIGMREWLPPFDAEIRCYGSEFGDLAFFHEADFVVSERFARLLESSKLTGLSTTDPITVTRVIGRRVQGKRTPTYFRAQVTRSSAAVDEQHSSIIRSGPVTCPVCRANGIEAVSGFALEKGTWSGEDVFAARGMPGIVVATERFREFVLDHDLSNITFVSIAEYRWPPRRHA